MQNVVECGARAVPKTQKNALLDDNLCVVLDDLQRLTGATFARLTTAAFLKYIFGGLQPAPGVLLPDDQTWMRLAVDIERGDLTVGEVPKHLVDRYMGLSDQELGALSRYQTLTPEQQEQKMRLIRLRGSLHAVQRRWCELVADSGGEDMAIRRTLEAGGFPPIPAAGYGGFPRSGEPGGFPGEPRTLPEADQPSPEEERELLEEEDIEAHPPADQRKKKK